MMMITMVMKRSSLEEKSVSSSGHQGILIGKFTQEENTFSWKLSGRSCCEKDVP